MSASPATVTLHLGAHRTGTTALQRMLLSRPRLLAGKGIRVWGPQTLRDADWAALFAKAGADRVVLSDENLIGTMFGNFADAGLYPRAAARMLDLAARLPVAPAEIVVGIRDYADYWASAYTHLAVNQKMPPFNPFMLAKECETAGWTRMLQDIRAAFPATRLRVWCYSADPAAVPGVCAAILGPQLAQRLPAPAPRTNASLSATALAKFAAVADQASDRPAKDRHAALQALRAEAGPKVDLFGADLAASLSNAFAREWQGLRQGLHPGIETFDPLSALQAA